MIQGMDFGFDDLKKDAKKLMEEYQKLDGSLSVDTILSLVDAGYAAALAVDAETGAVRLDTEVYKELAKAKIEAQKADLLEQRAGDAGEYREDKARGGIGGS